MRDHLPNLFLTRTQFYENCTVGKLTEAQGHLICMTLEPRLCNLVAGERWIKGKTCVAAGDYPLFFGYDSHLKYQCWRLGKAGVSSKTRISFLVKGGSVPNHTQDDILVGYLCGEDDRETDFAGILHRPVKAFSRLHAYYSMLRANYADFMLRIEALTKVPVIKLAVESLLLPTDQIVLEDYILHTF